MMSLDRIADIIKNDEGAIDGSAEIMDLWYRGIIEAPRSIMEPFILIISESDHLPLKKNEALWHESSFDRVIKEKIRLNSFYKRTFEDGYGNLIRYFSES